jgi:hypothetical protein
MKSCGDCGKRFIYDYNLACQQNCTLETVQHHLQQPEGGELALPLTALGGPLPPISREQQFGRSTMKDKDKTAQLKDQLEKRKQPHALQQIAASNSLTRIMGAEMKVLKRSSVSADDIAFLEQHDRRCEEAHAAWKKSKELQRVSQ